MIVRNGKMLLALQSHRIILTCIVIQRLKLSCQCLIASQWLPWLPSRQARPPVQEQILLADKWGKDYRLQQKYLKAENVITVNSIRWNQSSSQVCTSPLGGNWAETGSPIWPRANHKWYQQGYRRTRNYFERYDRRSDPHRHQKTSYPSQSEWTPDKTRKWQTNSRVGEEVPNSHSYTTYSWQKSYLIIWGYRNSTSRLLWPWRTWKRMRRRPQSGTQIPICLRS